MNFSRELGMRLCENLGVDPEKVLGIDFSWRPDELPIVTVAMLANEGFIMEVMSLAPVDHVATVEVPRP